MAHSILLRLGAPLLAAMLIAASPISAVPAGPTDVDGFVREFSARQGAQLSARWVEPVCVKITGIADSYAAMVVRRVQDVARQAGAPVGGGRCKPNVLVTFTSDGPALMAAINRADPTAFKDTPEAQRGAMLAGELPISWWYRTALLDADGRPLRAEAAATMNAMPAMQLDEDVTSTSSYGSSLIRAKVQRGLKGVGIVVDINRIAGRPLRAVSSFIAMVALAEVRAGPAAAPTVMAAWTHPDYRIDDLTRLDIAYLRALYESPPDRDGGRQRESIAALMRARLSG